MLGLRGGRLLTTLSSLEASLRSLPVLLCCLFVSVAHSADLPPCAVDPGPRAAVENFMHAMKSRDFSEAYKHVTANMTDARPVGEWAALQKTMFDRGGVRIGAIDVRAARRDLNADGSCAPAASVPNVLHASDVLNTQTSTEFEVYRVVLQDGAWKIDAQETLFEQARILEYFPGDKVPEFGQTRRSGLPGWIRIPEDLGTTEPKKGAAPARP